MKLHHRGKAFYRNADGATMIEFAIVAPIFFFLTLCIIELGLMLFSQIALESATMQVSRSAAIGAEGSGCDRACTVRRLVEEKTRGLINGENVVVEANTLSKGGVARVPEVCATNPPTSPVGSCPPGFTWNDTNGNGEYDGPGNVSVGNPGDLVEIRVSYPWKMLIPFLDRVALTQGNRAHKLYGNDDGVVVLSASTVIKNEPF